ncbi:surface-adhesin E family protein [Sphaerotilus montanus]|uniref:Surface-adhesin protein E-like domain-containing protein n=1 Tax=Sphaerotilus montanus TaxID=522889 RepID=A0A7Y9QY51_9BURK|nr:surface-adhesin E family protein [Sphaerotilus montanus]NYG33606.1 hypothetical protein [Sphaerotilus montanus]
MKIGCALSVGLVAAIFCGQAGAATWYGFNKIYTDKNMYYFDRDTVMKTSISTTLWVKVVTDTTQEQNDGIYSVALKYFYNCSARTLQVMVSANYDKTGKFLKSFNEPGRAQDIIPDSIGEGIMRVVCASDFPKSKSRDVYFPIEDSDLYKNTNEYFEYIRSKADPAPK